MDSVNVSVLLYVPVRNASVRPMVCRKFSVTVSLFMLGSDPPQAAALLFADRNVVVESDQLSLHGCA